MSHVVNVMLVTAGLIALAAVPPLALIFFILAASSEGIRRGRASTCKPSLATRQAQFQAQQERHRDARIRAYKSF